MNFLMLVRGWKVIIYILYFSLPFQLLFMMVYFGFMIVIAEAKKEIQKQMGNMAGIENYRPSNNARRRPRPGILGYF